MRRLAALVAALLSTLLLAGCGGFAGLSDVPLPGGPDLGANPKTITIEAPDVLELARQATVKVDDVTVGVVDSIERQGWHAQVKIRIRNDVDLPANTVAAIRQTGLLGEKYVELAPPADVKPRGSLADGAVIPIDRTSRSAEVEEVLGALSLLLNGGGIDRLHTITTELNNALDGREEQFRGLLTELTSYTSTLNAHRADLVEAINGLDRFSSRAAAGHRVIQRALARVPSALRVLANQRRALVRMLTSTSKLSDVATTTIDRTRAMLLANLRDLDPVLTQLAAGGRSIPQALEYLLTFPFPTNSLQALKGDFFDVDLEVKLSELNLTSLLGLPIGLPIGQASAPAHGGGGGSGTSSGLGQLGSVLQPSVTSLLNGLLGRRAS